jgi:predicted TIM-barrel fold metal-dependent hydrolase
MKPSAYFRRQCHISTEVDERATAQVIAAFGEQCVTLGSDYPHGDGKFPHAIEEFLKVDALSPSQKRQILWDNPVRLYGLEREAARLGEAAGR